MPYRLVTGDDQMFSESRNRVNREQRMCRANYYQAKVEHLKKCKQSEWWKEVKKLSGRSRASTAQSDTLKSLQHLHEGIDQIGLANITNKAFLSSMHCLTLLPAAFNHKPYSLLPPPNLGTLRTPKNRKFQVPRFKTIVLEKVLI